MRRNKTVRLDKIIIPEAYVKSPPKPGKLARKYEEFLNHGEVGEIVINKNKILVDGYCQYIIAKNFNIKKVRVTVDKDLKIKRWKNKARRCF